MAQLRCTAVRRGSKNDCDKDEAESENNGYVPGFANALEQDNQNIVLSWLRVMISSMSSSQQRTILAALFGASVFLLGIVGYFDVGELFRRLCGLTIPILCVLSIFYWIALYLRKTWHATSIYILFCSCYAGELFGQCFASESHDITHPFLVVWVLSCVSLASVFSSLQTSHSCIIICSMSLTRLISCTSLVDIPQCLRPYVNYSAGLIGVIIAKYTETLVRPHVNSLIMHDGKIPVIKRRRSSSSSAHGFASHSRRRTSLPALSQKSQSSSGYESALLGEAHGLITDMLADSTLPPHVVSGLRALGTLLKPPENHSAINKPPRISPLVSLTETSNYGSDTEDSPYTGERPSSLPKRLRRSLPPSLIRRMSTSTWTTTTSATGMPTLEPEPCRTRSSSFRYSRDSTPGSSPNNSRSNSPSPMSPTAAAVSLTIPKSRSFSIATTHVPQSQRWAMQGRRSLFTPHHHSHQELGEKKPVSPLVKKELDGDGSDGPGRPTGVAPLAKRMNITSDYESSDSPSSSDLSDGHVTLEEGSKIIMAQESAVERLTGVTIDDTDSSEASIETVKAIDLPYDLAQFENVELLQKNRLCEWDYPIFTLSSQLGDNILSQVSYRIFIETGLFETFRIPLPEFMNYFNALEMGYRDKPYHNRVHATDVLHGVYYLATQPVPGFTQIDPENDLFTKHSSSSDSDADASDRPVSHRPSFTADDSYGIVGGNFPPIELMAMFTSAAMHDYDHPGRTNAFLVATNAPLAVLYNDRSVLESHHAASAWSLVLSDPKFNWLCHLDKAEFKRFRYLVIEAILATDLKRHFEFLAEFNAKVNDDDAPGIDWFSETDRLLVTQMAIKLADINGPCKRRDLHTSWTSRISDEFYEQGDEENALGLPISPYMDRNRPQLAKLQESFINHLVAPLCNSYSSAGLLPGAWVEADDDGEASESESDAGDSSPSCKDTEDESPMAPKSPMKAKRKSKKIFCHLTKNLKDNHTMWVARIKEEEMQRELSSVKKKEGEATESGESKEEMSPIEEVNEGTTLSGEGCKDCERNQQQSQPAPSGASAVTDCTGLVKSEPDAKPAVEDWGVKPKVNRKKSQLSKTNSNASSKSTDSTAGAADGRSRASPARRKSSESSDTSATEVSITDTSVTQQSSASVKSSKECTSLDSHNNNLGSQNKVRGSDNSGHRPEPSEISSKASDT